MVTFRIFLNFIYYFAIKHFYGVYLSNIYKLLYSKFDISNMTMTGITSVTPGPLVTLLHIFNVSITHNINEGNILSTKYQTIQLLSI